MSAPPPTPPAACPRCASPLAGGALSGQCPRCLATLAFGADPEDRPEDHPCDPPAKPGPVLIREIGRGGMGVVYEAFQAGLERRIAVKMLAGGPFALPQFRHRFRAEAEAVARLRHPNIVTVHEIGEFEGRPYLAMEFIPGPSLADLVQTHPLAPLRAARYLRQIAAAIAHAHTAGVLHRDLKPSNVLLDDRDQPRVTDFGLAKLADSAVDLTRTGEVLGSPGYLPPEQVAGAPVGPAGDVYSLGAILYELLTGRPPFAADSIAATLQQVLEGHPVPPRLLNGAVPRDLETVCLKCLNREPARRYATAAQLASDLERFERGEPVHARPVPLPVRLALWCRRKPALATVSAAFTVSLVAGLLGVLTQWRHAEGLRADTARHLYAADVAAAAVFLEKGNLGRARDTLLRHAPSEASHPTSPRVPPANDFTWRLLCARSQGDDLGILATHPWIVTCVAVSPDGRWIASGSQAPPGEPSATLQLQPASIPPTPPPPARSLACTSTVWSLAFTADSRLLASAGAQGVRFWNVPEGTPQNSLPPTPGHELTLAGNVLVASPNHPFFAADALEPLVRLDLDARSLRTLSIRGRHPSLSPDGRRLAVLDADRNLQVYDLDSERLLFTAATNHLVLRLRFSPGGDRLVAAGQMTAAKVWDLETPGRPPQVFRTTHNVWDAAFTPDGQSLLIATSHQQVEVWTAATVERRASLAGHENEVWTVAPTPEGHHLVSGGKDGTVRKWSLDPATRNPALPHWRHARPRFSPDGTRLLTYTRKHAPGTAAVWELPPPRTGERTEPRLLGSTEGYPCGFAPDGLSLLFVADAGTSLEWRRIGEGTPVRTVGFADSAARPVPSEFALSNDARSFVCLDAEGGFQRWSTVDGRLLNRWSEPGLATRIRTALRTGQTPERLLRGLAISRTGRWLALGVFNSPAALLVDFEGGQPLALRGHRDDVACLAFSPDDRRLATGSIDGTVRLWEVATGRPVAELPGRLESVEAVAFSADGLTLASINPGIEVTFWHLPTARELARIAHPQAGYALAFSPDGRRLALATTEGNLETDTDQVEIWDAP